MKQNVEGITYGYGRCSCSCSSSSSGSSSSSTFKQNYEYEKNALIKEGIKEENIYLEYASGADKDRPELNKLMSILKKNDTLVVTDITRLSRSTSHFCDILKDIEEKHVRLIVGTLIVDCRNDKLDVMVEAMLKISAVFGEMERKIRIEQIKLGQENARRKGHKIGRPALTKDDIPDSFYKNLHLYQEKRINKSEFARLMNWSRPKLDRILQLYNC